MGLHLIVLGISACIIILLLLLLGRKGEARGSARKNVETSPPNSERERPCPLCGEMLKKGQSVHTKVFQGRPDSIAHIYGCPFCFPENETHRRICPVCKKTIGAGGYVIARMFEGQGKRHVHVLGCTSCRVR